MITTAKVKEVFIERGKRLLKVFQFGAKTAKQASAFGDDSHPLKDMTAIFANTSENGEPVIIGYINNNQLAAEGEKRIFSLKNDGSLSNYIWLKNNEIIEIGGNVHNAVRFLPLKNAISSKDALINTELSKIATALSSVGGTYVPGPIQTNIDAAKNDKIKIS